MLKVTLNRLIPQADEIIAEKQAGFRAGRSNLKILCEKYLQHQKIYTMSSLFSRKSSTGNGMQPYGPPCGSTISVQIYFAPLRSSMQGYKCSSDEKQHKRMVQNNCWNKAKMFSAIHLIQQLSRTDYDFYSERP